MTAIDWVNGALPDHDDGWFTKRMLGVVKVLAVTTANDLYRGSLPHVNH